MDNELARHFEALQTEISNLGKEVQDIKKDIKVLYSSCTERLN